MEPVSFIRTKLNHPRIISNLVERPLLVLKLNEGLNRNLTLVSAPAGYGKTTLVCQWLNTCNRPAAWLSLDEYDNDLTLFLKYLIAAIRTIHPNACQETELLSLAERLPPVEYMTPALINDIAALPEPFILVLDDYQVITDLMIHDLIDRLIRYLPAQMHLVICCRTDPPIPLSLLRGRQQINELRLRDLRFSVEKTAEFLEQAVGKPVDGELARKMERRVEGWVTGLRLAALSMQDSRDSQVSFADFGRDTNIMLIDYLIDEVLSKQPPSHLHFLIRTSIFNRFCSSLCDAILINDDSANPVEVHRESLQSGQSGVSSQEVIQSLEQSGFYITALDDQRQWYRYHDLFRDILRQRFDTQLSLDQKIGVRRRASAWHAAHGHIDQALQFALAGDDTAGAIHLVEEHRVAAMNEADWRRLERWLGKFPDTVTQARPSLLLTQSLVFGTTKVNWASRPTLERAANLLRADKTLSEQVRQELQAEVNALLAPEMFFAGEYEQALTATEYALQHLPLTHSYLRGYAQAFQCLAHQAVGRVDAVIQQVTDAAFDPNEPYPLRVQAFIALCFAYLTSGELQQMRQSARYLRRLGEHQKFPLARAWSDYFVGVAHYEWNELDEAAASFEQVFRIRYLATSLSVHMALIGLTKAHLAADRLEQTQATIDNLRTYVLETGNVNYPPEIDLLRSLVLFRQNHAQFASRWGQPVQSKALSPPLIFYEDIELMQITVGLVQVNRGDWQPLSNQLQTMLQRARQGNGILRCIQVQAHLALVFAKQERLEDAFEELQQALNLAHPGGFIRSFVDLGAGMADLIRQFIALAPADEIVTDYAVRILNAFPVPPVASDPVQTIWRQSRVAMTEPLTRRESEVLELLAQHLSYLEIANQLVITLNTVKKHASHVYAKLGVNSRDQAIEKAVLLQVLPPA